SPTYVPACGAARRRDRVAGARAPALAAIASGAGFPAVGGRTAAEIPAAMAKASRPVVVPDPTRGRVMLKLRRGRHGNRISMPRNRQSIRVHDDRKCDAQNSFVFHRPAARGIRPYCARMWNTNESRLRFATRAIDPARTYS